MPYSHTRALSDAFAAMQSNLRHPRNLREISEKSPNRLYNNKLSYFEPVGPVSDRCHIENEITVIESRSIVGLIYMKFELRLFTVSG